MMGSPTWTAALLVTLTIPMAAHAGTAGSGASRACETALRNKVRAEHPNSGRVEVLSDSEKKKAGSQTAVTGTARVETRDAGWRRLTFDCLYNTRGEAASVRYDIGGSAGGGSDTKATPTYVCKRAVAKRIHNDHPASGRDPLVGELDRRATSGQPDERHRGGPHPDARRHLA